MFEFGFGRHGSGGREDGGSGERGLVANGYRFERSSVCVVRPDDGPGLDRPFCGHDELVRRVLRTLRTTPAGPRARVVRPDLTRLESLVMAAFSTIPLDRLPHLGFSRPARRSLTLRPDRSPNHPCDPFIKDAGALVTSTAASIATGWNDPLPGGTDSR